MGNMIHLLLTTIKDNMLIACIIAILFIIIYEFSLAIIFKKIKQPQWKAFVPIYNVIVVFSLLEIPTWMIFLLVIPFVNLFGVPILLGITGWKLGEYCYKGPLIRVGLIILPGIFYPLLAYSRINLDDPYGELEAAMKVVPKEEFSLDAVDVQDVEVAGALELNKDVLDKISPIKKKEKVVKAEPPKEETKDSKEEAKEEIKKESKVEKKKEEKTEEKKKDTTEAFTLDYSSLYGTSSTKKKEEVKEEKEEKNASLKQEEKEKKKPEEKKEDAASFTLDYSSLYGTSSPKKEEKPLASTESKEKEEINTKENSPDKKDSKETEEETDIKEPEEEKKEEEKADEPFVPVVHEVLLEEAKPITDIGPISINQRHSYKRNKKKEEEEPVIEEPIPQPDFTNIPIIQPAVPEVNPASVIPDAPQVAAPPELADFIPISQEPVVTPSIQEMDTSHVKVEEIVVPQDIPQEELQPVVSFEIQEPTALPVAEAPRTYVENLDHKDTILEDENQLRKSFFDVLPDMENTSNTGNIPGMSKEEAMGFAQKSFLNPGALNPSNSYDSSFGKPVQDKPSTPDDQSYLSIFQTGTSGAPLLRDMSTPQMTPPPPLTTMKKCPVCGTEVKVDCPVCMMCGHHF